MQRSRPLVAAFAALGAAVAMLPPQVRERFREATLRPSVATALRAPIERAMAASHWGVVVAAQANADGVLVTLADGSRIGSERVIWATGHRPSVLHDPVAGALLGVDATDGLPEVSRTGESVRPGVFFVGPWTIGRFGPPVRFLIGTHWQARMVARAAAERARA
jgi:pyruvate/2-oxoglutarate dehydrogenase complex dihydrolipoamide dehydrogenase (E3) component